MAQFGLRFKLPDYLIELYRDTFKNDLSHTNGDSSWTLPMPAHYVIGTDGVIGYAEVNPDSCKSAHNACKGAERLQGTGVHRTTHSPAVCGPAI